MLYYFMIMIFLSFVLSLTLTRAYFVSINVSVNEIRLETELMKLDSTAYVFVRYAKLLNTTPVRTT